MYSTLMKRACYVFVASITLFTFTTNASATLIEANPSAVYFEVETGTTQTQSTFVEITNIHGTDRVEILGITMTAPDPVSNAAFSSTSIEDWFLNPLETAALEISFDPPTEIGLYSATFEIQAVASQESQDLYLPVSGSVVEAPPPPPPPTPEISITPDLYNFGVHNIGTEIFTNINISNIGDDGTLAYIDNIELLSTVESLNFSVFWDGQPIEVLAGTGYELITAFNPIDEGDFVADILVHCDNCSIQDNYFKLEGTGVSIVPIPSAVWLFGTGLIGLIGIARRMKS